MAAESERLLVGHGWFMAEMRPVVCVHSRREIDDADYDQYLALIASELDAADGSNPALILYDVARGPGSVSAGRRKRLAQVVATRRGKLTRAVSACAVVADSALSRGIATALLWLISPPYEVRMVANVDEAFAWFAKLGHGLEAATLRARYDALVRACEADPRFGAKGASA